MDALSNNNLVCKDKELTKNIKSRKITFFPRVRRHYETYILFYLIIQEKIVEKRIPDRRRNFLVEKSKILFH